MEGKLWIVPQLPAMIGCLGQEGSKVKPIDKRL